VTAETTSPGTTTSTDALSQSGRAGGHIVPSPLVGEGQGGGDCRSSKVGSPPTPNPSPHLSGAPSARRGGGSGCGLDAPSADILRRARAALENVTDPELPFLTIADMGILRDVRLAADGNTVKVAITPTYSGCPAMDVIALDITTALARAGFPSVRIERVLSPAWTTDWLSPAAREKLRVNGIAPPERDHGRAQGKRALFAETAVVCPMCGSAETERVSEFGSTACKASYRCRACREPFQYFKCI
jgi:ring-1,2-phenylacetyl-CoA epoxidase subunit PaaD